MTRDERLVFCKGCTKRKVSFEKGLLCSLTNDYAVFEDTCIDYRVDEKERERIIALELAAVGDENNGDPTNASHNKKIGSLIFFIGAGLTVLSFAFSDEANFVMLFYGAIIWGAAQYYKGVEQEKVLKKHIDFEKKEAEAKRNS